jgi:HEAT repeat protein
MLKDENQRVRLSVINLLGKVGNKASLLHLGNLSDPENQEAVKVARDMLESKLGKN